jgi:hypothetical protein
MNTYTIYMPPESGPDSNIDSAIYLPDNKAWFAAIVPPLWFIWHRLWWGLTIYVAYLAIIFLLLFTPWQYAVILLSAIPGIYLFLEGHELVRQHYENQGWWQIGVVQANGEDDAVLRYTLSHNSSQQASQSGNAELTTAGLRKKLSANSGNHDSTPNSIGIFPLDTSV